MDPDLGMFIPVFDELLSYCSASSWEPRKNPTGMTMSRPEDSGQGSEMEDLKMVSGCLSQNWDPGGKQNTFHVTIIQDIYRKKEKGTIKDKSFHQTSRPSAEIAS